MAAPAAPDGEHVARVIREALDAVAAPPLRDRILRQALYASREPGIPPGGERLRLFVEQHLSRALAFALGDAVAEAVLADLEQLVSLAALDDEISRVQTSTSPRARPPSGTQPDVQVLADTEPAPEKELAIVLVASRSTTRHTKLRAAFGDRAIVQRVEDALSLLDAISAHGTKVRALVVDCEEPSVHPETFSALQPDLPPGARVVLWGAGETTEATLVTGASAFYRADVDATEGEIVALCRL